ncbi:hypothetical protein INR49_018189 [Caranx melampygus]|nr:hypothetical protein INR49_018189 [Caranx melampygus]
MLTVPEVSLGGVDSQYQCWSATRGFTSSFSLSLLKHKAAAAAAAARPRLGGRLSAAAPLPHPSVPKVDRAELVNTSSDQGRINMKKQRSISTYSTS